MRRTDAFFSLGNTHETEWRFLLSWEYIWDGLTLSSLLGIRMRRTDAFFSLGNTYETDWRFLLSWEYAWDGLTLSSVFGHWHPRQEKIGPESRWPDKFVKKIAQNVAKPNFSKLMLYLKCGKGIPKMWSFSVILKITASPNGRFRPTLSPCPESKPTTAIWNASIARVNKKQICSLVCLGRKIFSPRYFVQTL
jgi:hypothetical protein